MPFRKTNKTNNTVRRSTARAKTKSRFLELAIVAIFALVVIYGASLAIRITHGFSKTIDTPEYTVRLRILNACGINGAANQVTRSISGLVTLPIEVKVVDVGNFDAYDITKSFIISHEKDLTASKLLAEQLGLNVNDIIYESIENNYRSMTATLILGSDFELKILKRPKQKEN